MDKTMGGKPRAKPDCQKCGVCCIAPWEQDRFCDVTEKDVERLPTAAQRHVRYASPLAMCIQAAWGETEYMALATKQLVSKRGPLKNVETTTCVFLNGSILSRVSCRVYEQRPKICHTAIKPGDRDCRAIRSRLLLVV